MCAVLRWMWNREDGMSRVDRGGGRGCESSSRYENRWKSRLVNVGSNRTRG